MSEYPNLLEPIKINGLEIKNRVAMAPMSTNLGSPEGFVTDDLISHFEARAQGGVGLIFIEDATVDGRARYHKAGLGLNDDKFIPGWKKLVSALHNHGAKVAPQLIHPTFSAGSSWNDGRQPVAASTVAPRYVGEIPRELTIEEIKEIINLFGEAAQRAVSAGCDAIEIHAAHAHHLLASFMSALQNKRTDMYGGSMKNRCRLAVEVVQQVRKVIGPDIPIIMRISGDEYAPGGRTAEETKYILPLFIEAGVDSFLVSGGTIERGYLTAPPAGSPPAINAEMTSKFKKAVNVPIICIGRIKDPYIADRVIADGQADMVGMGRALLADPQFIEKSEKGIAESIRPCLACLNCLTEANWGRRIACTVNPDVGKAESLPGVNFTKKKKRVLIIGAGLAGMEAGLRAAQRGHDVTIIERTYRTGGQFISASFPPTRQELTEIIQFLENEVRAAGVNLQFGIEATSEWIKEFNPDAMIIATGAVPIVPSKIPGIRNGNVVNAVDTLLGKVKVGPNVLVIGGGMVGCETADFLAHPLDDMKKGTVKVTILEMMDSVCSDDLTSTRSVLIQRLKSKGIEFLTGAEVTSVLADGVSYRKVGTDGEIHGFDHIVLAIGSRSEQTLAEEFKDSDIEIYTVGDAKKVRKAWEAIAEGAEAGRTV